MAKLGGHPGPLPPSCSPARPHTGDPESIPQSRSPQSLNYSPRSPLCGSIQIPITIYTEPTNNATQRGAAFLRSPRRSPHTDALCTQPHPASCSLTRSLKRVPTGPSEAPLPRFPHGLSQVLPMGPTQAHRLYATLTHTCLFTVPAPNSLPQYPHKLRQTPHTLKQTHTHLHPPEYCTQPGLTQPVSPAHGSTGPWKHLVLTWLWRRIPQKPERGTQQPHTSRPQTTQLQTEPRAVSVQGKMAGTQAPRSLPPPGVSHFVVMQALSCVSQEAPFLSAGEDISSAVHSHSNKAGDMLLFLCLSPARV